MEQIVQVKVGRREEILHFFNASLVLKAGDYCVVELDRGADFGQVVGECRGVPATEKLKSLRKVLRLATDADKKKWEESEKKKEDAFRVCREKIRERKLDMHLIDVDCSFDGSKIIFYFKSAGRVDFRELVKDLARVFKARIELRQIGVRDETKMLGGCGPCGRILCCSTFLRGFEPVTVRMAKEQELSLNPAKISGLCGRLMCCLMFEHETYKELRRRFPKIGAKVVTSEGVGKIIGVEIFREIVKVEFEDGREIDFPLKAVSKHISRSRG